MEPRPYLLLDVDGPLNPYRAEAIPPGYQLTEIEEGEKSWRLLLNQQHGVELTALAETFDLAWASSWEHGANRLIAPALGLLTNLPVISWPPGSRQTPTYPRDAAGTHRAVRGMSWKTRRRGRPRPPPGGLRRDRRVGSRQLLAAGFTADGLLARC